MQDFDHHYAESALPDPLNIVFRFATSKALIEAKHTNAGLRDQIAAFECTSELSIPVPPFYGLRLLASLSI